MKVIFVCLLIVAALWLVARQTGADKVIENGLETGRTAAEWMGR